MAGEVLGMAGAIGGTILDQALAGVNTRRQVEAQKELGEFNQALALEMWDKTNYAAQRKQMEKAGLNVGLMYKGAGQGGTTQGGQAGSSVAPQGNSGMGMTLGLQAMQTKAQTDLLKAQAENVEADTAKKRGVDTDNVEADTALKKLNARLGEIEYNIKDATQYEVIGLVTKEADKLYEEIRSARAKGDIDEATVQQQIKMVDQAVIEQSLRIAGQKAGLIKTAAETASIKKGVEVMTAQIQSIITERVQSWDKLSMQERETYVKEMFAKQGQEMVDFNTSTPQQIRQWTGIVTDIIGAVKGSSYLPSHSHSNKH